MSKKKKRPKDYLRRIKIRLWEKDPHCYYCGVLTILPPAGIIKSSSDPNLATIDHVYSKFNLMRWVKSEGEDKKNRYVLSCQKCNNERQRREYESLPLIEQSARNWGFGPSLKKTYSNIIDVYLEMRKIYSRYGVPTESIDRQIMDGNVSKSS